MGSISPPPSTPHFELQIANTSALKSPKVKTLRLEALLCPCFFSLIRVSPLMQPKSHSFGASVSVHLLGVSIRVQRWTDKYTK